MRLWASRQISLPAAALSALNLLASLLLASLLLASLLLATPSRAQQQVDPALAASWTFAQKSMPGVSYDMVKAACAEKTVMLYHGTWADAQKAEVDGFVKRFPCIQVQSFGLNATGLRSRFLSEIHAGAPVADIIQDTDPGTLNNEQSEGLLMKYVVSNDSFYPDGLKSVGYWYPLRIALVGIAWNTDLVSDKEAAGLNQWTAVADPKWKGRAGVTDVNSGGVVYLPWFAWRKLYGDDFIRKVGKDVQPRVYSATNPASAALAAGDIAILLNASETGLLPLQLAGAPIRWSLPEPGIGPVTGQAISAKAPHPNAARLFQDYSFTEEGYGLWQKLGGATTRIGFKDQRPVARESWYKAPNHFFKYNEGDATKQYPVVEALFRSAVAAKP